MTSIQKKNVFGEFRQDDYRPTPHQLLVKYRFGKGNNLHEVEDSGGRSFLVSMPKKFRGTIWLKKGDTLVVDPIAEGKKVLGEIACILPEESVLQLIEKGEWPHPPVEGQHKDALLAFFTTQKEEKKEEMDLPPSEDEEEEEEEKEERLRGEEGSEESVGFKSRVDFVTSGSVTVTNVTMDVTRLAKGGLQSLDFETEDSSSEERGEEASKREAHTIRIQVNYRKEEGEDVGEWPKGV